jgi:hypothetical protein
MDVLKIDPPDHPLDPSLPDAGLPPAQGVHNFQIFRASSDVPQQTDHLGYTYHHHVDMAAWKGRLYVGWNSCQRDEDVWPSRELYSTSEDGSTWTAPAELFPQGLSTCLRIYFYHAPNGKMLAIAGLRTSHENTDEDLKNALVVREIRPDHTLAQVFILQANETIKLPAPRFTTSPDAAFKEASQQLLADTMYLEQQDRGRLLGPRRMKWHDPASWPGGVVPGDNEKWVAGKAFSFYQRPDRIWVGVSKMGWVTTSADNGQTWSQPALPPSLITGKAKVWSQRTADGNYTLVYNPSKSNRYPLIAVTSPDGIHFSNMRIIQGELPIQRYPGLHRSIGPQYVRGISHWANDHSRSEQFLWLVYSMNKEDIWISRVPLPMKPDETSDVADNFTQSPDGPFIPNWNLYRPKWSTIEIKNGALHLENRDPYDYAQATRLFPESAKVNLTFDLELDNPQTSNLEIDLLSKQGSRRVIQLKLGDNLPRAPKIHIELHADSTKNQFTLTLNNTPTITNAPFATPPAPLHRITFRTAPHRLIGGPNPVPKGTDHPVDPTTARIRNLTIST